MLKDNYYIATLITKEAFYTKLMDLIFSVVSVGRG